MIGSLTSTGCTDVSTHFAPGFLTFLIFASVASYFSDFWSFWLFGSLVPSITSVLPAGGAPLSGSLIVISVGADWYSLRRSCAVATPAPPPGPAPHQPPGA